MEKYSLTPKQSELLIFLKNYLIENNGVGPSGKEMSLNCNTNLSHIHSLLQSLQAKGHIKLLKGQQRAFSIVGFTLPTPEPRKRKKRLKEPSIETASILDD